MSEHALVLTFHSISDAGGPTSIGADVFDMQMRTLAQEGYCSLRVQDFADWHGATAGQNVKSKQVLITFDDAFEDFADVAVPILRRYGFSAVVFVPTARIGEGEVWKGASQPARPLMDWATIRHLAREGFEFGGHSRTHPDLTLLDPQALEREVADCARELKAQIGATVQAFAAPYGHVNARVIETIGRNYSLAFGTRLALARRGRERFDIPRIEMHYFRSERHWRHMLGGKRGYFRVRQLLRNVRAIAGGVLA